MADETQSKDGKGQGGCCGCCIGCSVLIALVIAFVAGFYIVPTLRDNDWSMEVFPQKIKEFRIRLGNKIDDWNYRYIKVKDAVEDKVDELEDKAENVADNVKRKSKKAAKKVKNTVKPLVDGDLEVDFIED